MSLHAMDLTLNLNSSMVVPSCIWDCDLLLDLGPPPDLMSEMPPPPIPTFLRDPVEFLKAANGSCDLCRWAGSDDVQLVEVPRKYPLVDDMWYFVIVSAVVGAILFGILVVIATLRCKEAKVKPVHDKCSKVDKAQHPSRTVEPTMVMPPTLMGGGCLPLVVGLSPSGAIYPPTPMPKALWSALKGGNVGGDCGYVLHHHPVSPELLSNYEHIDYGAVGHTRPLTPAAAFRPIGPPPTRTLPPPPPPLIPPPPIPTSRHAYGGDSAPKNDVHILGNGNAYYANPDSLDDDDDDGSFENGGYVDSECSLEVRKVAPDGAVVGRRGRPCFTPVRGGGWEEAILRQRVGPDGAGGYGGPHKYTMTATLPTEQRERDRFAGRQYVLPPVSRLAGCTGVSSSPMV